jgi:hypothetical protein
MVYDETIRMLGYCEAMKVHSATPKHINELHKMLLTIKNNLNSILEIIEFETAPKELDEYEAVGDEGGIGRIENDFLEDDYHFRTKYYDDNLDLDQQSEEFYADNGW